MDIRFLVPCYNTTDALEAESRDRFYAWANKLKPAHFPYLGMTDAQHPRTGSEAWRRQKGIFVRRTLIRITNDAPLKNTIIILIDGSGKIKFDSVIQIINALEKGYYDVVMGARGKSWAIDPERQAIELFENFLIETRYACVLPDAQCGCWGFHGDLLKMFPFTANAYEIELDLIISTLATNRSLGFAEVHVDKTLMTPRGFSTQFNPSQQHIRKLAFLADKLDYSREIIQALSYEFQKGRRISLPPAYTRLFDELDVSRRQRIFKTLKWSNTDKHITPEA